MSRRGSFVVYFGTFYAVIEPLVSSQSSSTNANLLPSHPQKPREIRQPDGTKLMICSGTALRPGDRQRAALSRFGQKAKHDSVLTHLAPMN